MLSHKFDFCGTGLLLFDKGDAINPIHNTLKTTSAILSYTRDQQVSAYNHSFITIIQNHGCKNGRSSFTQCIINRVLKTMFQQKYRLVLLFRKGGIKGRR